MKTINDNQKITLTVSQLKRLVESFNDDVDFVTVRVDVAWDSEDADENGAIPGVPSTVYIKIPTNVWKNKKEDLDLSTKLEDFFGPVVDNFDMMVVDSNRAPRSGVLYWNSYALEEW